MPVNPIIDSLRFPSHINGKRIENKGFTAHGNDKAGELAVKVKDNVGKLEVDIGINTISITSYDRSGKKLASDKYKKFASELFPGQVVSEIYRFNQIVIDGGKDYEVVANRSKDNPEENNPINPSKTTSVILGPNQQGTIKASGNVFGGEVKILNLSNEKTPAAALLRSMRDTHNRELASA